MNGFTDPYTRQLPITRLPPSGPLHWRTNSTGPRRWVRRDHSPMAAPPHGQAAQGAGFRGGNWNNDATNMRVSDRNNAANTNSDRNNNNGGRGCR